jgi:hypothetical protein
MFKPGRRDAAAEEPGIEELPGGQDADTETTGSEKDGLEEEKV